MFRPQANRQPTEPRLERLARPPADHLHNRTRSPAKRIDQRQQLRIGRRLFGRIHNRHERAVVIQEDRQRRRRPQAPQRLGQRSLGRDPGSRFRFRLKSADEIACPAVHVVGKHPAPHRAHPCLSLARRQRDCFADPPGEIVNVVGVDRDGFGQLLRRAGEFAEHEHAVIIDPGGDVLLRHEIHAVTQRRHQHHVRSAIQGDQALLGDRLMQIMDRHRRDRSVRAVDASDHFIDLAAERPVRRHLVARRHRDLDQPDAFPQCRVVGEQPFQRQQPSGNALRIVQAIDAEQERPAGRFSTNRAELILDCA